MQVLHIITEKKWRGGEQQVAYFIAETKKKSNLKINHIVVCPPNSHFAQYCQNNNIIYIPLSLNNEFNLATILEIRKLLNQFAINLIHAHSSKALGTATLAQLFSKTKIPIVLSRRVAFPIKNNWFNKVKYNQLALKKILCVSQNALQTTQTLLKDNPHKCLVIYDGIDLQRFNHAPTHTLQKQYKLTEQSIVIANIAALEPEKDVLTFINAAEIMLKKTEQPLQFFIVGDGSQKKSLEQEVANRNLQGKILFTGFIADIATILPDIDILLVTSLKEGLCSIALEAFAAGKPVVASNIAGINEIVLSNQTGLTATVGNAESFAEQTTQLIQNIDLKKRLSSQAYDFAKAQHSIEKITQQTIDAYFAAIKNE